MPIQNINTYFFPYEDPWIGSAEHYFVLGFPFDLQDFDEEQLKTRLVMTDAIYVQPSNAQHLHRIKLSRKLKWSANGLSGAPVFYLKEDHSGYFVGLAGIINRAGDASCSDAYFIEARCLPRYLRFLPNKYSFQCSS